MNEAGAAGGRSRPYEIVIVGGGPRMVLVLERLASRLRGLEARGLEVRAIVHVIDDVEPGAGRVWRRAQPRELCMNTLAHAVSLFTDDSVTMTGRVEPGPTMYEWALLAGGRPEAAALDPAIVALLRDHPPDAAVAAAYDEELAAIEPHSHPSRALFGEYTRWCAGVARARLPPGLEVVAYLGRAVALDTAGEGYRIELEDGDEFLADAVVLAPGWLAARPTAEQRALEAAVAAAPGLVWVRGGNPADQPLDLVPAGADTIVRGLGMGFFDAMALVTIERGGRFVRHPDRLRYEPSGAEPVLWATSPRGYPYRAKSRYGGLPPRSAHRRLRRWAERGAAPGTDFRREVWPLIVADALEAYIARLDPGALAAPVPQLVALLDECGTDTRRILALAQSAIRDDQAAQRFRGILSPAPAAQPSHDEIARAVADDLAEADRGEASAEKAALWSIAQARTLCARLGAFGAYRPDTMDAYRMLHAIGAAAGSGPPAFRVEQLLALVEAGLVHFLGPAAQVQVVDDRFRARSASGAEIEATALIDALVMPHDAERSADPLMAGLIDAGLARPFRLADGTPTGGIDVEPGTWLLRGRDGRAVPRLWLIGIPLEATTGDTLISPMPGSDATMLREADAVAAQLADLLAGAGR